jgi:hypothetical protein
MSDKTPAYARLYVLLARDAAIGLIFRRGPTEWTQLIHWDTKKDIFTSGQWFKWRVYERKSDLSPDGKLLIYFAAKYHRVWNPPHSYRIWTAISRPPYFTALHFMPDVDTYGGGGFFLDNHTVAFNSTSPFEGVKSEPYPGFKILSKRSYFSTTVYDRQLEAAGWSLAEDEINTRIESENIGRNVAPKAPTIWHKHVKQYALRLSYTSKETRYYLTNPKKGYEVRLEAAQWADFDYPGRVSWRKQENSLRLSSITREYE